MFSYEMKNPAPTQTIANLYIYGNPSPKKKQFKIETEYKKNAGCFDQPDQKLCA